MDSGRGLKIEAPRTNQPNKNKLSPLLSSFYKQLYTNKKTEHFSYKSECDGRRRTCTGMRTRTGGAY